MESLPLEFFEQETFIQEFDQIIIEEELPIPTYFSNDNDDSRLQFQFNDNDS